MTNSSIPSAAKDTVPRCVDYSWCDLDHRDPGVAGVHEKQVTIEIGDVQESFTLEAKNGVPRLEFEMSVSSLWIEPGEPTNTMRNLAAVLARAADLYDQFVRDVSARATLSTTQMED